MAAVCGENNGFWTTSVHRSCAKSQLTPFNPVSGYRKD
jgi:hypothetical protein